MEPRNQFNAINMYPQRPIQRGEQQFPEQVMSMRQHLGPSGMDGYLQSRGVKQFTNPWTAQMLRPQDIRPEVQREPLVTPAQLNSMRGGFRGSLGLPNRQPAMPVNPNLLPRDAWQRVSQPVQGGIPAMVAAQNIRPAQQPVSPGMTPAHAAQLQAMDQQQEALRQKAQAYGQNQSYQGAVDAFDQEAQAKQFYRPSQFTPGETAQARFTGNPSTREAQYGQRFDSIAENRQAPQSTADTGPSYQERLASAGIPVARPYETPAASTDTILSDQDRSAMRVLGNSPAEWEARKAWLSKNGFSEFTPEAAAKWGLERQQQAFAKRDMMENARRFQDSLTKERMQARADRQQLGFKMQNPGLYTPGMQYLPAQLVNNLNGSRLPIQQEGLSPQQAAQLSLQQQQINLDRAAMTDDPDTKERYLGTRQGALDITGSGVGQSTFGAPPVSQQGYTPREMARRALSTSPEQKKLILDKWAADGRKPTPQEMSEAGITEQDLSDYYDSNSYGPMNGVDWLLDQTPFGDSSSRNRQKRYDWGKSMVGPVRGWGAFGPSMQ